MKSWIRFEDTYAMPDIFRALRGEDFLQGAEGYRKVSEDLYIGNGFSSAGCFDIKKSDLFSCKRDNVLNIYFVFDVDNCNNNPWDVLSIEDLFTFINTLNGKIAEKKLSINTYYLPIIFCAETIGLYSLLSEESVGKLYLDYLISNCNINKFYSLLAAISCKSRSTKSVKRFRDWVDFEKLKNAISISNQKDPNLLNKKCYDWLLNGCPVEKEYFYTEKDLMIEYPKFIKRFNQERQKSKSFIVTSGDAQLEVSTDDDIEKLKDFYRSFWSPRT